MGWGLPIITTYQSGSVVEPGVNGYLSNAGDLESLRLDILKLAYDGDLRTKMGMESLERSKNYSVEMYGKNLLNILTQ